MTVLEVIQRSSDYLGQKGVESPRLQIELLLAHVLKLPRLQLYLNFQRELKPEEVGALREMVRRRAAREPWQHIVGSTSFCGVEIRCAPGALIPRPETELLAERAWEFLLQLAAAAPAGSPAIAALEVGTGTGCIAIAMARNAPEARIVAVDISPAALDLAIENATKTNLPKPIEFRLGDAFVRVAEKAEFDLVVSNPPYIASSEIETLDPEVRDHDPRLALDGGPDGLDVYRRFAREGGRWLRRDGRMMLEFGDGQGPELRNLFESQNWIVEEIVPDYSGRPRILIARLH